MDSAAAPNQAPAYGVFEDGLGRRRQITDPSGSDTLEMLCLRGELTRVPSFEFALRERASHLAAFSHVSYGRVRSVERLKDPASTLALVSERTDGMRLSEMLRSPRPPTSRSTSTRACLLRQLVPAIAMLHENMPDIAHGAIGPERLVVTPDARLIVVEHVLGSALEQLRFSQERYWRELRIAVPRSAGLPRFDHRADVTQIGVVALSLILGRRCTTTRTRRAWPICSSSAWAISARGGLEPLPPGLRAWLMCALQLDAAQLLRVGDRRAGGARHALLGESDYLAAPATLESFLERYRRRSPKRTRLRRYQRGPSAQPVGSSVADTPAIVETPTAM